MDEKIEFLIGDKLRQQGLKLMLAESCSGGLISHLISNVPGSSDYYLGSIVSYSNEAKQRLLGVRYETLETYGAVSRETVLEMARGVCQAFGADVGLSVSGIAGPGGGTPDKPVGLVWLGLSTRGVEQAQQTFWKGDRLQIKEQAAEAALALLLDCLLKTDMS